MVIVKEIIRTYYTCNDAVKLDIDTAIKNLAKSGDLDERELLVLYFTREQYTKADIEGIVGIPLGTVSRALDSACEKIANYLGPDYQDDKILRLVGEKLGRPLTDEEINFCLFKMRNFRHKGMSKINLFNFGIEDGRFIERGEDKTEG